MPGGKRIDTTKTRRRIEDALRKNATPEDLIRIAEALGVEVAFIPEVERPCFGPEQVRCLYQIRKGLEYREVDSGKEIAIFTVVREPFRKTEGWWIEVEVEYERGKRKDLLSLQDHNIFPYESGKWNEGNWIAFTDKSRHLAYPCCHHHRCS